MDDLDRLSAYRQKRDFNVTPEPAGGGNVSPHALRFVIQKHWARSLHYDFRLEFEGTLKSWAVPKGPSLDPHVKRMAVEVEDHPLAYGDFEGVIPAKQYGAGRVIVWDTGEWLPTVDAAQGFKDGKLKFELRGHKLQGHWALVRTRGHGEKQIAWLLIKEHDAFEKAADDYDITQALPGSVNNVESVDQKRAVADVNVVPATSIKRKSTFKNADLPSGAVKANLPQKLAPQLATLVSAPLEQGDWLYEVKFDGYRLLARMGGGVVTCLTRNGHDWTLRLPQLAKSLDATGLVNTWLDGEIVVLNAEGVPDFQALQHAFDARNAGAKKLSTKSVTAQVTYYVFDIPFYNGYDLRSVPLSQRRELLERVLEKHTASHIKFSAAFDASPKDLMLSACKLGLEGLIGKRADSPYQSRRSPNWIKLKCGQRQAFLICGYTDPKGARTGLGALLLGHHDDNGKLQYAGNVGSGFSEKTLVDLTRRLEKFAAPASPFAGKPAIAGKPHWVKPTLLADVSFTELTNTGRVRHGVFHGLITHERVDAMAPVAAKVALPASLRITHPERVIDAQSGMTKLDIINYYGAVAAVMLPHLKGRPVSLVRAPSGTTGELFFQKHAKTGEIPGVKLLDAALDPGHASLLEITNAAGLLSSAQMNTLEFHTWNGVAKSINTPDRMIFDLDPGEKASWSDMQEAALLVRTLLEALGLVPFIKTSGGKGLHVVVPLKKQYDWDTVKGFSEAVVQHLAKTIPQKFVAKSGPANRVGKIFVDYLRNGFGATTVSAWSARARSGMGVSVPFAWDELQALTSSAHWTTQNITERINVGNSVWNDYAKSTRGLTGAMKTFGYKNS